MTRVTKRPHRRPWCTIELHVTQIDWASSFRMRFLTLWLVAVLCYGADWTLYVCAATTKNYVVGAKLLPSGLFSRQGANDWRLQGHPNPFTFALDYDPNDPIVGLCSRGERVAANTTRRHFLENADRRGCN